MAKKTRRPIRRKPNELPIDQVPDGWEWMIEGVYDPPRYYYLCKMTKLYHKDIELPVSDYAETDDHWGPSPGAAMRMAIKEAKRAQGEFIKLEAARVENAVLHRKSHELGIDPEEPVH